MKKPSIESVPKFPWQPITPPRWGGLMAWTWGLVTAALILGLSGSGLTAAPPQSSKAGQKPAPADEAGDNLLPNGDFEENIEKWKFWLTFNGADDNEESIPRTESYKGLAWEKGGAQGSKGCLKVTMPPVEKPPFFPWSTGALNGWRAKLEENECIKLSFYAKGDERREKLQVHHPSGCVEGMGGAGKFDLDTDWAKYEVTLTGPWYGIIFSLVDGSGNCTDGTFFLDNVTAVIVEKTDRKVVP